VSCLADFVVVPAAPLLPVVVVKNKNNNKICCRCENKQAIFVPLPRCLLPQPPSPPQKTAPTATTIRTTTTTTENRRRWQLFLMSAQPPNGA